MLNYYLGLALRSLVRNPGLTLLMVTSIGVGIGASMTTFAVFHAIDGDPIAYKATQLYVPQIENWDPGLHSLDSSAHPDGLSDALSYIDAVALMRAHAAPRQTALYETRFAVTPPDPQLLPFRVGARAGYADLFAMFDVPFAYGGPWSAADDGAHAAVAVISRAMNDKVFGGGDSVGKVLRLDGQDYRVVGVLRDWNPVPRYYDLQDRFDNVPDDVFVPFTRAVDQHKFTGESDNCGGGTPVASGWNGLLRSECVWLQFWVQLPTAADAERYRAFLHHYAQDQQGSGRFHWAARTRLRDLPQWLSYEQVVSNEVRMLVVVGFTFLLVCLVNAMGLMLARMLFRSTDTSVRRALGANRGAVFAQGLIEAAVIGAAGAVLGVLLTALGLASLRALLSGTALVARMDLPEVGMAIALAIVAAMAAGLYPTWRATRVQPAWQLRAQ
ncbi:MAG TPA: ABC transporter permease [Steroidobacteraceae bacterium]|jgi:putative ABC transport system permease protein|nr:ABC transporter permease [Steroidobacteraceae bacterium]